MASAISGVKGIFYGSTLVDLKTGGKISFEALISGAGGSATPVQWADIQGKPQEFPPIIGATGTTAKAGNYVPSWSEVSNKPTTFAPVPATASVVGGVKKAETQADSVAADVPALLADFNGLLAKLKAAGIMA